MKKYFSLIVLLACSLLRAQTTTISATVIDPDGQPWASGTWQLNFNANPSQPNVGIYNINGVPLNQALLTQQGSLDAGGTFSQSGVYDNTKVLPGGSSWSITICPNASVLCTTIANVPISGPTMNLSALINSQIKAPRFPAQVQGGVNPHGYSDTEISPTPSPGGSYFNVSTSIVRTWTGTTWVSSSGGGGGSPSIAGTIQGASAGATSFISSNEIIGTTAAGYSTPASAIAAACAASSKAVYFPAGIYTSGLPLSCNGLHIRCASGGGTLGAADNGGTIFKITGANWGLYNPNADVTTGDNTVWGVTVDNCGFDISTDPTNVLGAWRIKGIRFSHFSNNMLTFNNNVNPVVTEDGGNLTGTQGDYDNVFIGNNIVNQASGNAAGTGTAYLLQNSSNDNHHYGGSISRAGIDVHIASLSDNDTFDGIDGENWVQTGILLDPGTSGNEFTRFRLETGVLAWTANQVVPINRQIIDSNGNRQIVTIPGTNGSVAPTWATTLNATTVSGTATYTLVTLLPTDVIADGSVSNIIDVVQGGFECGIQDSTGKNNYPVPVGYGCPTVGNNVVISGASHPFRLANLYYNTLPGDTSTVFSGDCADGFHPCLHFSGTQGGEIQASRAYLLCNQTTGCGGYTRLVTSSTSPQTITIPDNAGLPATVALSGQSLVLAPTGTATAPTPNFGSKLLQFQGSYYTGQLAFGRYLSGGAFTGTGVCNVDTFNNGSTATATLPVTSGAIPVNTQLTITSIGSGATAPPTTAVMNGTCTGGATASGTINLTNVSLGAGLAAITANLFAPIGTGSNPGLILQFSPGTTSLNNAIEPINSDLLMFNNQNAVPGQNFAPNKITLWGHSLDGSSANANDIWNITPTIAAGLAPTATLTISHTGPGTGILALPAGTTVGGVPVATGGTPVRAGTVTVSSGTTGAATFGTAFSSGTPFCNITPTGNPTTAGVYWITSVSTSGFTANIAGTAPITFNYVCSENNTN